MALPIESIVGCVVEITTLNVFGEPVTGITETVTVAPFVPASCVIAVSSAVVADVASAPGVRVITIVTDVDDW